MICDITKISYFGRVNSTLGSVVPLAMFSHIFVYTVHDCLKTSSTFSPCDSRNLNLSPFCNTSSTSLAMWQPSVLETYGEQKKLDYLDKITGPMRQKYPNSMGDRELITSLTEVKIQCLSNNRSFFMRPDSDHYLVLLRL